jgi:uncharacterized protein YutE (UPF0331/DUF86 family)
MTISLSTRRDLIEATARKLTEKGYDVFAEPESTQIPEGLKSFRPDAIALGKVPKLFVVLTKAGLDGPEKIAKLQEALRGFPDWKLHLVVDSSLGTDLNVMSDNRIKDVLDRMLSMSPVETRAALLVGWSAFEALCRARMRDVFSRPQTPARLIDTLASDGTLTPEEAGFLRNLAKVRNGFIHGDLEQSASAQDIEHFHSIISKLIDPNIWPPTLPDVPEVRAVG